MKCINGKHQFAYFRVKFKTGKLHIGRSCDICKFKDFIRSNKLPHGVTPGSLPLQETSRAIRAKTVKPRQIKTITRKKETNVEVIRITKVVEKPVVVKYNNKNHPFYSSREWLQLRYHALLKYGRKCMCCSAMNVEIHVDHIKPRSLYPKLELDINNLQVLCRDCNLGKSNLDSTDFRPQHAKV